MFNLIKEKKNKGFTLIETMVSISILLIAIVGPLVMAMQGLKSSRFAKNQIISFYIAQDAIEYIRSVRDTNILSGSYWLNRLSPCTEGFCTVDVTEDTVNSCVGECPYMTMSSQGLYGYSDLWDRTGFLRKVRIYDSNYNADEVYVEVEVLWDNGERNFKVRESLLDLN